MHPVTDFFTALAVVLWPLIVVVMLITFQEPIADLIRSAKSRKFSLKIGGQELTMEEADVQQRALITDLQSKMAEMQKHIETLGADVTIRATAPVARRVVKLGSLLWVDDNPKNNSYFIEALSKLDVRVDLAPSTSEGLSLLHVRKYDAIISDMSRMEGAWPRPKAGLAFLSAVREFDTDVPFYFFCGNRSARENRDEALKAGADGITSSSTELYALLNLDERRG